MLFLIPNLLAPDTQRQVLPEYVSEIIKGISCFIVEDVRNARRYISSLRLELKIEDLFFFEMGKHSNFENLREALNLLEKGENVGLISEAGCPAVADPGRGCGDRRAFRRRHFRLRDQRVRGEHLV